MKFHVDLVFGAVIFLTGCSNLALGQECNGTETYIKRNYFRPRDLGLDLLLNSTTTSGITLDCIASCSNGTLAECPALLVDYDAAACFRVNASFPVDSQTLVEPGAVASGNVNYFQRVCLQVPTDCSSRRWPLDATVGYELVGFPGDVSTDVADAAACGQLCLDAGTARCRSAGFFPTAAAGNGTCVLSAEDRRTKPDAYRASLSDVVYLENQCRQPTDACPMNDFPGNALASFTEVSIQNITADLCELECLSTTAFVCRGFDFVSDSDNGSRCSLHSDDSYSLGPGVIASAANTVYRERVFCLNLSVSCSPTQLRVTLRTALPFTGRLYAFGHGDANGCDVGGSGGNETTLALALRPGFPRQECGVALQRMPGVLNRFETATALVQIQYNAIIQRRGDRLVRVSCRLGDAPPPDLTLEKNVTFPVDGANGVVNVTVNSTTAVPSVRLRIVDLASGANNTNETFVGKALQIRIENNTPDGALDVVPALFVATNGDGSQSYSLLDSRGCPADAAHFPGFRRDGDRALAADFNAFRFPGSPVVRFKLMLHLCETTCIQPDCNSSQPSLRNRRDQLGASPADLFSLELTGHVTGPGEVTWVAGSGGIPLEVDLFVLPSLQNEPVILARTVEATPTLTPSASPPAVVSTAVDPGEFFCLPNATALGVLVGWILLQLVILLVCGFVVRYQLHRQDKELTQSLHEDLLAFDNNRFHGHWSQNLSVPTPENEGPHSSSRHRDLAGTSFSSKIESPYL